MTRIPFQAHDGGARYEGLGGEPNDCTVRALAIARRIAYSEAHAILEAAGRKPGEGFSLSTWLLEQPWAKCITLTCGKRGYAKPLSAFRLRRPIGTYIVCVKNHATVLRDGEILDLVPQSGRLLVAAAFLISAAGS